MLTTQLKIDFLALSFTKKRINFVVVKDKFSILKNKYILTLLVLFIWVAFFDKNDIASQYKLSKQVHQLEEEKEYFINEIGKIKKDLYELTSNPKMLEKFAREKYLMKKDNEEVFVIVEDEEPIN